MSEVNGLYQRKSTSKLARKFKTPHVWHCAEYKELLDKVVPLRTEFRKLTDASARKEMAKEELGYWTWYLDVRKEEIRRISAVRD